MKNLLQATAAGIVAAVLPGILAQRRSHDGRRHISDRFPRITILLIAGSLFLAAPRWANAQFTYTNCNGALTITCYIGSGGNVSIPGTINGFPVVAIGGFAFATQTSLRSVTIPNSVASIGDAAFCGCSGLTNVAIPNSVTSIGDAAFSYCSGLTNAAIPNSVTNIGNRAFYFCTGLRSVTIPSSVTSIGDEAFYDCYRLTNVAIPNSVTSIGDWAFEGCTGLTDVTIPDRVASIGEAAFYECTGLRSVTIPNSVTSIGDKAFWDCTSLSSVTIPNSVTSIGDYAFSHCTGLRSVAIPNSVTNIGDYAFYSCSGLTSVTIPDSVTNIGDVAFQYCSRLQFAFFLGNSPAVGGPNIFYGCSNVCYYLAGKSGWGATYAARPASLWNPAPQVSSPNFGVATNRFGFNITGTADIPIVVEATTNVASGPWVALGDCTLTNGCIYFSDPAWTNFATRAYRIRSP